ncbi:helix-turn-helix transcriptional regulator [Chryseobacterium wangxinyae]|uniref:helix-turn-helix domain-containing protein n=1 Tax=Chryseobacterium sp. CY350 TaxID=2997336 RepID=UPI00226FC6C3|nr:response regulator transcription factor [Chryseobacterium sp. CY350]MCY0977149.1 helix-turn-helix transcriptional regulator [Chryseobacterium sp. CY350]WBZ95830.1 helix-turn-helix transcriptional regulator [Chryseobacterium sp. CY350]
MRAQNLTDESSKFEKIHKEIITAKNRDLAFALCKKYIDLAKKEDDTQELLNGYESASGMANDSIGLKYGDSILTLAVKLKDQVAIGNSYYTIATRSLMISDYKKASEFSVIAYEYYLTQKPEEIVKSIFTIAKLKSLINEDESAQKLLNEQYQHLKKNLTPPNNKLWYRFYLTSLIMTNAKLQKHKENEFLIKESYNFDKTNKEISLSNYQAIFADAYNDFYMKKYTSAIRKINLATDMMGRTNIQVSENVTFLLAQCYWKTGKIDQAFPIFEKIKNNFLKTKKTTLAFRPAFDFFTEYYKKNGTTEQQLASLNDLLEFDKFEKDVKNYVQLKLKDFDDKHKTEEQALSEDEQKFSDWLSIAIISLSSIGVVYFGYRKIKANKKKNSQEILEIRNTITKVSRQPKTKEEINEVFENAEIDYSLYRPINKLTVDQILASMKNFESSFGFLEQDLKLTALAQKFNTNDKYLSKVIKVYFGKTFNTYLTDLRFEYLDKKLKIDSQFKNQKIKEISSKLGFGSPEFFATAFKEKYGKSPKEYFES